MTEPVSPLSYHAWHASSSTVEWLGSCFARPRGPLLISSTLFSTLRRMSILQNQKDPWSSTTLRCAFLLIYQFLTAFAWKLTELFLFFRSTQHHFVCPLLRRGSSSQRQTRPQGISSQHQICCSMKRGCPLPFFVFWNKCWRWRCKQLSHYMILLVCNENIVIAVFGSHQIIINMSFGIM